VFSVIVPAVVRSDLVVDWSKRVMSFLLNSIWVQSCVTVRRFMRRSVDELALLVTVDTVVLDIASLGGSPAACPVSRPSSHAIAPLPASSAPPPASLRLHAAANFFTPHDDDAVLLADQASAEEAVWAEGAESLARVSEMLEHLRKLARVSVYALVGLVGAVPGALVWIFYAAYKGTAAWATHHRRLAAFYFASIAFAPVGAVVVIFVSIVLLGGIVSLSILGACVQFGVYWSTRIVYSFVRTVLTQAWADFPFLMRRDNSAARRARKAVGINELDDDENDVESAADVHTNQATELGARYHGKAVLRHPAEAGAAMACVGGLLPTELEFALASWDGGSQHGVGDDSTSLSQSTSTQNTELLRRLGMDTMVDTPTKRRLCVYYALGMLVHLQVTSGGNAWQIRRSCLRANAVVELEPDAFIDLSLAEHSQSPLAREAAEAVVELSARLRSTSRYRIVPIAGRNVPVHQWLRATLLVLMADPTVVPAWAACSEPQNGPGTNALISSTKLQALNDLTSASELKQRDVWTSPFTSSESAGTPLLT
jgi:hypothetical protein